MTTGEQTKPTRSHVVVKVGVVDSISGAKTIRVLVSRMVKHPFYGKYTRRRSKLLVHDPDQKAKLGDTVEIAQCRPISKHKSWRLRRVLRSAVVV